MATYTISAADNSGFIFGEEVSDLFLIDPAVLFDESFQFDIIGNGGIDILDLGRVASASDTVVHIDLDNSRLFKTSSTYGADPSSQANLIRGIMGIQSVFVTGGPNVITLTSPNAGEQAVSERLIYRASASGWLLKTGDDLVYNFNVTNTGKGAIANAFNNDSIKFQNLGGIDASNYLTKLSASFVSSDLKIEVDQSGNVADKFSIVLKGMSIGGLSSRLMISQSLLADSPSILKALYQNGNFVFAPSVRAPDRVSAVEDGSIDLSGAFSVGVNSLSSEVLTKVEVKIGDGSALNGSFAIAGYGLSAFASVPVFSGTTPVNTVYSGVQVSIVGAKIVITGGTASQVNQILADLRYIPLADDTADKRLTVTLVDGGGETYVKTSRVIVTPVIEDDIALSTREIVHGKVDAVLLSSAINASKFGVEKDSDEVLSWRIQVPSSDWIIQNASGTAYNAVNNIYTLTAEQFATARLVASGASAASGQLRVTAILSEADPDGFSVIGKTLSAYVDLTALDQKNVTLQTNAKASAAQELFIGQSAADPTKVDYVNYGASGTGVTVDRRWPRVWRRCGGRSVSQYRWCDRLEICR